MSDDRFLEQLRNDAAPLRYEPDATVTARMAAQIRSRTTAADPTVAELLARWSRPLAAALTAITLAAVIGLAVADSGKSESTVAISMAGETYSVLD